MRRSYSMPWLSPCQVHQLCAILGRQRGRILRVSERFELDLEVAQLDQLFVPAPLQFAGDQPIVGIDHIILATSPGGLVLGVLDCILDLLALVAMSLVLSLRRSDAPPAFVTKRNHSGRRDRADGSRYPLPDHTRRSRPNRREQADGGTLDLSASTRPS